MEYKQGEDSGTAEMLPDYIGTLIMRLLRQEIMLFFPQSGSNTLQNTVPGFCSTKTHMRSSPSFQNNVYVFSVFSICHLLYFIFKSSMKCGTPKADYVDSKLISAAESAGML